VAGFNAWRKLNRFVRKGEKAIWVLAPMVYKDVEDGETDRVVRGFKFVPVFDIAQTDGEGLPSICNRLEGGDPKGRYAQLVTVAQSCGFSVEDHEFNGNASGDCCHADHRIRVETTNTPAHRVKTLAHELAHALLHESYENRALAELEAESTAYVVCQGLGIDSGDYSFGMSQPGQVMATWQSPGSRHPVSAFKRAQVPSSSISNWQLPIKPPEAALLGQWHLPPMRCLSCSESMRNTQTDTDAISPGSSGFAHRELSKRRWRRCRRL